MLILASRIDCSNIYHEYINIIPKMKNIDEMIVFHNFLKISLTI